MDNFISKVGVNFSAKPDEICVINLIEIGKKNGRRTKRKK